MNSVTEKNLKSIKEGIKQAACKGGQKEEGIRIIAVTKNVTVAQVLTAIEAGITDIGENKAQEIIKKHTQLRDKKSISWHFVGHLQRNKVKMIIDFVDLIQSVDSLKLVEEINKRAREIAKIQEILVQVNIAEEEAKFGLEKGEVERFLRQIASLDNVKVKGLMNIAPLVEDTQKVKPVFSEMKMLYDDLRRKRIPGIELEYLSMGMTNDFEVAVESGANMVRIGTGIFATAS